MYMKVGKFVSRFFFSRLRHTLHMYLLSVKDSYFTHILSRKPFFFIIIIIMKILKFLSVSFLKLVADTFFISNFFSFNRRIQDVCKAKKNKPVFTNRKYIDKCIKHIKRSFGRFFLFPFFSDR